MIPYAIYGSYPIKLLQRKFLMPQASRVSDTIREGYVPINGRGFEILALGGHTLGHLGIRTPDDVVFTGDSLIPPDILHTNPFLYLADPSQQKLTIENLRAANSPLFYLSHGGLATDIPALINANHEMMEHLLLILKNIIHSPRTQEEIINEVIAQQDLQVNRNHYFRLAASISAFLAYLCNDGQASVCIKNNIIQYCAK